MYGFTEILPGRIITDKIASGNGNSCFNLAEATMLLGNKGYIRGMDFGVTKRDQLTIKGAVNAQSAEMGGFRIDNDRLQSLKKTNDKANILLDGRDGSGHLAAQNIKWDAAGNVLVHGALKSNSDGGAAVEINPDLRQIKITDENGKTTGLWKSGSSSIDGIALYGTTFAGIDYSDKIVNLYYGGLEMYGLNESQSHYSSSAIQIFTQHNHFEVIASKIDLKVIMKNLPTNDSGLEKGQIWQDSNGFLRIVT